MDFGARIGRALALDELVIRLIDMPLTEVQALSDLLRRIRRPIPLNAGGS